MNFHESTTILNATYKKSGNLLNTPRTYMWTFRISRIVVVGLEKYHWILQRFINVSLEGDRAGSTEKLEESQKGWLSPKWNISFCFI